MNRFCVMGVDPGATGAVAFIIYENNKETVVVVDYTTDTKVLRYAIDEHKPDICYREKVGSMPGEGVSSANSFGVNIGIWIGLLGGLVPCVEVTPKAWQKQLGLVFDKAPIPKGADKKTVSKIRASNKNIQKTKHLEFARRRFPSIDLSLRKHEGRADALLVSLYGVKNSYLKSNFK